jgi:hypothetical protein
VIVIDALKTPHDAASLYSILLTEPEFNVSLDACTHIKE